MDSRRYLPQALIATAAVIVLPALVVVPLAPFDGIVDLLVSGVLATGLSVVAGSIGSAIWAKRPESREIAFGDLMLWAWLRRVRAERRLAEITTLLGNGGLAPGLDTDPLLPALRRIGDVLDDAEPHSRGHSRRVTKHAERIARQMGLSDAEVAKIRTAASLHDVGKVGIPKAILVNPDALTAEERGLLERHAVEGAQLVAELGDPEVTAMVRHHHERIDGTGYPDGLAGGQIPLGARIIAVADSFDRTAASVPAKRDERRNALDLLSEQAGSKLDAAAVAAFLGYYSGKRSIAGVALAATAPQRAVRWLVSAPAVIGTAGGPPLAQGVCAAGAVAIAGVCLGGTPVFDGDRSKDDPAAKPAGQVADSAEGRSAEGRSSTGGGKSGGGSDTGKGRDDTSSGDGQGGRRQPSGSPGSGQTPASPPATSAPDSGGGGGGSDPVQTPDAPSTPEVEVPQPQVPGVPSNPTDVLDPVLDGVQDLLEPLPIDEVVEPVKGLLGSGQ